ncbi:MAG: histidinol-phosphatase [Verrucomicrobiales bacterium]|nr:histidinol-phosphatase [Verrucomicrobiales bacterium]|tara:strand:- start:2602 stop:3435 length:834 start_codon:yes stop_codon:yes gene_type:complete
MERTKPIFFDSHMHTPLCKHAEGHPVEYMERGIEQGLAGIIFTCHSPMPNGFSHQVRMAQEQFDEYINLIAEAEYQAPDDFEVRLGMESDFFPGMEEWLGELHDSADFHYILGSVHWHLPEYLDVFWHGDPEGFSDQYFEHLAESAETGLFDCLAHPDLVKNASPDKWNFNKIQPQVEKALDRIARTGVAMEINTSGLNKAFPEMNPGPQMLSLMAQRDIPVVVGSDSHTPGRVGENFLTALDLLEKAGYDYVSVFRYRKRSNIPISTIRDSLIVTA